MAGIVACGVLHRQLNHLAPLFRRALNDIRRPLRHCLYFIYHCNAGNFPPYLLRYGDKAPKSVPGRLVTICWMIIGMIFFSILTGTMTAVLFDTDEPEDKTMFGKRVSLFKAIICFLV